jgi:hypothetical protein
MWLDSESGDTAAAMNQRAQHCCRRIVDSCAETCFYYQWQPDFDFLWTSFDAAQDSYPFESDFFQGLATCFFRQMQHDFEWDGKSLKCYTVSCLAQNELR